MGDTTPTGTLDYATPMADSPTLQGAGSPVSPFSYSGNGTTGFDEVLDGLYKWGGNFGSVVSPVGTGATITYSFPTVGSTWGIGYTEAQSAQYAGFSASQQTAARAALQLWANVANINFVEVPDTASDVGQIRFALTDPSLVGTSAATYVPSPTFKGGDVWFSNSATYATMTPGNNAFKSLVHEIGHALGLKHPHEGTVIGDASVDWQGMTVMSYKSAQGQGTNAVSQSLYVSGPMYEDVGAVQYLYGANTTFNNTNTVYSWTPGQSILQTIWDGGGSDTIDASNQTTASLINLQSGQWSDIGPGYQTFTTGTVTENRTVMIAAGAVIENANGGSAADTINGNSVGNVLDGNAGNDTLDGGSGRDTALFSGNFANYTVARNGNAVTVTDNVGTDGTDTLSNIEQLTFSDKTLSLRAAANDFNGDASSDLLWSNPNGSLAQWQENGTSYIGGGVMSGAGGNWAIIGQADFNGDGKNDILWQDSVNGSLAEWFQSGTSYIGGGVFSGAGAGWTVAKIADFNGDGMADLLWQNGDSYAQWQMNGTSYIGGGVFLGASGWTLKGATDFTGDGKADLLWQSGNTLAEWYMDGVNYTGGGVFSGAGGTWSIAGLSDFNGDGKADILWSDSGGSLAQWQMNGASYIGGGVMGPKPTGWNLVTNGQLIA